MTLTYVGDLSTSLDKVRFRIGDKAANSGPLPGGSNFTDAELTGLLTIESSVDGAVAAAYEVLAAEWATIADIAVGPRRESFSEVAKQYQALAKTLRLSTGRSTTTSGNTDFVTRVDAYSDDIAADDT